MSKRNDAFYEATLKIQENLKDLKSAGLINVDLRKFNKEALNKVGSKTRREANSLIRNRLPILLSVKEKNGGQEIIKIPDSVLSDKKKLRALKSKYQIINNHVIVDKFKSEQVKLLDNGIVYQSIKKNKKGQALIHSKVEPYININDIKTVGDLIKRFKNIENNGYKITFSYFNNFSTETFSNIDDAIMYITKYTSLQNQDVNTNTPLNKIDLDNIVKNIQFSHIENLNMNYKDFITDVKDKTISVKRAKKFLKQITII